MAHKFCLLVLLVAGYTTISFGDPDSLSFDHRYYGISGGIGVTMINVGDVVDFISNGTNQSRFATAGEFFGAAEIQVADEWGVKLEYSSLVNSYNIPQSGIALSYSYNVQMPSIILHRIITGKGYLLKFGGGGGYHMASFNQDYPSGHPSYSAKGVGLKLDAEGNSAFDEHLFAFIGADVRDDILGTLKDSQGNALINPSYGTNVKMNFISVGIKFGLSYFF